MHETMYTVYHKGYYNGKLVQLRLILKIASKHLTSIVVQYLAISHIARFKT